MSDTLPRSVLDAADISAITQLVLTERESRDFGQWDAMRDCFHPDSQVRISWFTGSGPDFVEGSKDMARRNVLAKHRLGPVRVRLSGDRAIASLGGVIDIPTTVGGIAAQLSSHARMFYRVERRAGRWRLSSFEVVYQRDELNPQVPGESIPVTAAQLAGFRPSYRLLSFVLASNGYAVNDELAGEDRPERVQALLAELETWAGLR